MTISPEEKGIIMVEIDRLKFKQFTGGGGASSLTWREWKRMAQLLRLRRILEREEIGNGKRN